MLEQIARQGLTEAPADRTLARLLARVTQRYGAAIDAVVLYGSYLRGESRAMPDLYVLLAKYPVAPRLERWLGTALPPNVYVFAAGGARAKVSVLRTKQLLKSVARDFHPYFWARFAQPCHVLYCRDQQARGQLENIASAAAKQLLAAMRSPKDLKTSADYWQTLLKRTYAAELRSERAGKFRAIYQANAAYCDALFEHRPGLPDRPRLWRLRQLVGKLFSTARLLKAPLTFEDPIGDMLWKVERHSGQRLEATERQRRYPLLFAWPLIWRLYRRGGFK